VPLCVKARSLADAALVRVLGRRELFEGENREAAAELVKSWARPVTRLAGAEVWKKAAAAVAGLTGYRRVAFWAAALKNEVEDFFRA